MKYDIDKECYRFIGSANVNLVPIRFCQGVTKQCICGVIDS